MRNVTFYAWVFQNLCPKMDLSDYGGSPGSPEMHHCSSTTQVLGPAEVYLAYYDPHGTVASSFSLNCIQFNEMGYGYILGSCP